MTTKVIHEPQLDTILMVEKAIREAQSYPTKKKLLESLPRQVQYQTFNRILDYLESSNKIVYDGRKIVWVFLDNPKLKKLLETSVKLRQTRILASAEPNVNNAYSKHLSSRPSPT